MTFLDAAIVVCIVYNGFMGLKRGFIRLVLDITSLILSTLFGLLYYDQFAKMITTYLPSLAGYSAVLSFGIIWLTLFLLISALGVILDKIISKTLILGPIDRLLGLGIGVVKGLLFLLPLLIPLFLLQVPTLKTSIFAKPLTPILSQVTKQFHLRPLGEKPILKSR